MKGLLLASCSDDVIAPEVEIIEIGYENSGVAYAGHDLHIDAEIVAKGKIDNVRLTIHAGDEHLKESHNHHEEWQVDTTYTTSFTGNKNRDFHEHIDVPEHAEAGEYHLHLYVTDMEGNQSSAEGHFDVIHDEDHDHHHDH